MTEVETKAALQAIKLLNAVGAKYKIIYPDGTEVGELVLAKVEPEGKKKITRRRDFSLAYGTYAKLIRPMLKSTDVGQVASIPIAPYNAERLRSAATAIAHHLWGNGSHTSAITKTHVEILRIA
jgi:hypothetical protein